MTPLWKFSNLLEDFTPSQINSKNARTRYLTSSNDKVKYIFNDKTLLISKILFCTNFKNILLLRYSYDDRYLRILIVGIKLLKKIIKLYYIDLRHVD